MSVHLVIRPAAEFDLDQQAQYLAEHAGLETAHRFYDSAAFTFAFLIKNPTVGPVRETANPNLTGLRLWRIEGFERCIIFYLSRANSIEIVRVLHAHRDIEAILENELGRDSFNESGFMD